MERGKLYKVAFAMSVGVLAYGVYITAFAFLNVWEGVTAYAYSLSGLVVIIVLAAFAAVASRVGLLVNRKRHPNGNGAE